MNPPRNPGLRNKIVAVLASLVALWAFAAYVTVSEGVSLVWLATLEQQVAKPTEALIAAIQEERRESVAYAAAHADAAREAMDTARAGTDQAMARMRTALEGTAAQWATSAASDARLADLLAGLDTLPSQRAALDAARIDRIATGDYFTGLAQLGFDVYDTYTAWDDSEVIYHTSTLVLLTHSQEMVSREDAVMAGVLGAGRFTEADRARLAELVGAQRYLSRQVADRLPQPDRGRYQLLLGGPALASLRVLEDQLVSTVPGAVPAVAARWRGSVTAAITALRDLVLDLADLTVQRFRGAAIWIIVRLVLAAGLGLVAVIASIRFTIRALRNLQDQLTDLRVAALDLAQHRLPGVVERLRLGEDVDVAEAAPPLAFGADDIGQVGHAFNEVQQTAIQATVDQAALRRGVRDVFLSLAHRIQALVHRQLKLIDHMERQAVTDDELADLFRIDHLATRMRRNAENLIVLAGVPASRTWRGPVPFIDVIRAALAEVEDYPRVRLRSADTAALAGRAVGDLIHLLAELMENALSFSPPRTNVVVTGRAVPAGYLIEIEDRGLGMTDSDLVDANRQLAEPPEFQLAGAARLGFYVVGRLAYRHQIQVRLRRSGPGGVTAAVLVPEAYLDHGGIEADRPHERLLATVAAATAVGRHAPAHAVLADTPPTGMPALAAPAAEAPAEPPAEPPNTPAGLPWREKRPRVAEASAPRVPRPRDLGELQQADSTGYPNGRTPEDVGRFLAAYVNAVNEGRERAERAGPAAG